MAAHADADTDDATTPEASPTPDGVEAALNIGPLRLTVHLVPIGDVPPDTIEQTAGAAVARGRQGDGGDRRGHRHAQGQAPDLGHTGDGFARRPVIGDFDLSHASARCGRPAWTPPGSRCLWGGKELERRAQPGASPRFFSRRRRTWHSISRAAAS